MKKCATTLAVLCLLPMLACAEDVSDLLSGYKQEADFSKITRQDTAGIIDVFTRDDLDKMQAHNLMDIFKIIPGIYLQRGSNNLSLVASVSAASMSLTYTRLYINDHDMTSSSFGSAFLMWGELPLAYIDHIEVYKATSSVEFGNENAAFVIRVYTKTPQRDSGSQLHLSGDNLGSYYADFSQADILDNGLSYFAYADVNSLQRTPYYNTYNNQSYPLLSDKKGYNLYANITYKGWSADFGRYQKQDETFLGIGVRKTPQDSGLDANHNYVHITKNFQNDVKLQLSLDKLSYKRVYRDSNGIYVANAPVALEDYELEFDDDILSVIIEKTFHTQNNSLLVGAFYKYKEFESHGLFQDANLSYVHTNSASNALKLSSIYAEDTYSFSDTFRGIVSLKGDFFRYRHDVKSQDEFLLRTGFVKSVENLKFKLFYSKGYIPLAMYQVYNPENMPYRANPQLNSMKTNVYSASAQYKKQHYEVSLDMARMYIKDTLIYDRTTPNGWVNSQACAWSNLFQLTYSYAFDVNNKLTGSFAYGNNDQDEEAAPQYQAIIRSFNSYQRFDFYNELIYSHPYSDNNLNMGASFDFTSSVQYRYTQDLRFGIRGENIFHDAYQQSYRGLSFAIPVSDQKFWLSMEYNF